MTTLRKNTLLPQWPSKRIFLSLPASATLRLKRSACGPFARSFAAKFDLTGHRRIRYSDERWSSLALLPKAR
jgi:hypothetical protein